eukprot:GFYU01005000.1.p1 GENE.GFYU01005000.1~~GFYU01005000.1.p1  ORF type:complete len:264 (-),score=68.72 GFYU01005000.1:28-819(-)
MMMKSSILFHVLALGLVCLVSGSAVGVGLREREGPFPTKTARDPNPTAILPPEEPEDADSSEHMYGTHPTGWEQKPENLADIDEMRKKCQPFVEAMVTARTKYQASKAADSPDVPCSFEQFLMTKHGEDEEIQAKYKDLQMRKEKIQLNVEEMMPYWDIPTAKRFLKVVKMAIANTDAQGEAAYNDWKKNGHQYMEALKEINCYDEWLKKDGRGYRMLMGMLAKLREELKIHLKSEGSSIRRAGPYNANALGSPPLGGDGWGL